MGFCGHHSGSFLLVHVPPPSLRLASERQQSWRGHRLHHQIIQNSLQADLPNPAGPPQYSKVPLVSVAPKHSGVAVQPLDPGTARLCLSTGSAAVRPLVLILMPTAMCTAGQLYLLHRFLGFCHAFALDSRLSSSSASPNLYYLLTELYLCPVLSAHFVLVP